MGFVFTSTNRLLAEMAMHDCPRCSKRGFTWYHDDERSPETYWRCNACDYFVTEDESLVEDCGKCGGKSMTSVLVDGETTYRYCFACKLRSVIVE